jgi:putative membrane protein
MRYNNTKWIAIGAAAVAAACAMQPGMGNQAPTNSSASNPTYGAISNASVTNGGMWIDSAGGTWMDGDGAMRMGGRNGMMMGLQPADIAAMSSANIVAHLAAGDSMEIALSQTGASRAQNAAVRDFANRMVNEHSTHLQMGRQLAQQNDITPAPSPADTVDARMGTMVMNRLSNASANASYDRQFMRAEVMMHQHMLHELTMIQPQATGAARQLVDQTIPVVQQHLSLAQSVWRQVGGGMNNRGNGAGTGQ